MRAALLVVAVAWLVAAGCCTVRRTADGGRDLCYIQIDGWRLLGLAPIVSGDPKKPNRWSPKLFADTTSLDASMKLLDDQMRRGGFSSVRNLSSYITNEDAIFLLLQRVEVHTSAELVR